MDFFRIYLCERLCVLAGYKIRIVDLKFGGEIEKRVLIWLEENYFDINDFKKLRIQFLKLIKDWNNTSSHHQLRINRRITTVRKVHLNLCCPRATRLDETLDEGCPILRFVKMRHQEDRMRLINGRITMEGCCCSIYYVSTTISDTDDELNIVQWPPWRSDTIYLHSLFSLHTRYLWAKMFL